VSRGGDEGALANKEGVGWKTGLGGEGRVTGRGERGDH